MIAHIDPQREEVSTQHELCSTIANSYPSETPEELIDSGATHHIFFSRSSFYSYERNQAKTVIAESRKSRFVEKGEVLLLVSGGITVKAYRPLFFSSNVLSVGL